MDDRTQWTIKGLTPEIIQLTREAVQKHGSKLGPWVEAALRAALKTDEEKIDELFDKAAVIQKKYFDALIKAGFTPDDAIALVAGKATAQK